MLRDLHHALVFGAVVAVAGCATPPPTVTGTGTQAGFGLGFTPLEWSLLLDLAGLDNLVAAIDPSSGNINIHKFGCSGGTLKPHALRDGAQRAIVLAAILNSKSPSVTFDNIVPLDCGTPYPPTTP